MLSAGLSVTPVGDPIILPMSDSPDTDQRLMALEVKISYLEDLTDTLNGLVARQQQQIEWLARELVQQRRQGGDTGAQGIGLPDERPPHY